MSNTLAVQRQITHQRCKRLFEQGASIDVVIESVWVAAIIAADRDTGAEVIESGCVDSDDPSHPNHPLHCVRPCCARREP